MKGVRVAGCILGVLLISGLSFLLGCKMQQNRSPGLNGTDSKKVKTEAVAIVNQDAGIKAGDGSINYGTKLLADLPDGFEITGLEIARNGLKSGNYAAYVILPTSFSECVVSLNDTPRKAEIQFAINEDLDEEIKDKVALNTMAFINGLNHDLSYMYISTVLKEFHTAQDAALVVMEHDISDRDVILEIKPQDLLELVPVPELERLENNQEYLDIQKYITMNQELVDTVDQQYTQYISLSREDYEKLNEEGIGLVGEWSTMETTLRDIDLTHDEQGDSLYEAGLLEASELLKDYNQDLERKEAEIGDITEIGIQNITAAVGKLDQMLADYKTLFQAGISEGTIAGLKAFYPQLNVVSGQGDTLMVNAYPVTIPYGDTTINQMPESDWKTQYAARAAILEQYVMTMEPYRIAQSQVTSPQPEPTAEGEDTGDDSSGETPNPVPEWVVAPKLLADAGYASWDEMYQEIQNHDLTSGIQTLQIDKHVLLEEFRQSMQQAIDSILDKTSYELAIDRFVSGLPLFETKVMDTSGEEKTIQKVIEEELKKLEANTGDELLAPVKVEDVQTTVTEKVVQPLVDKTETVKDGLLSQYGNEETQMQAYGQLLGEFDPLKYIEQDEIQKTVRQMEGNGDTLQDEIDAYGEHGVDYADKLYTAADENISMLGRHLEDAQKTSEDAVKDGLLKAQETKESNSTVNQALMLDLTKKLPFTRLGSLEFAKSYEFMANPLEVEQKSGDQREPTVAPPEKRTGKAVNLAPILPGILILLVAAVLAECVRRFLRRRREWGVG